MNTDDDQENQELETLYSIATSDLENVFCFEGFKNNALEFHKVCTHKQSQQRIVVSVDAHIECDDLHK